MTPQFSADNANEAWIKAFRHLVEGNLELQSSRVGSTREILHASVHINDPRQRWILSRLPAFNPAFAIAEIFWILAGNNESSFINYWNPILPRFAGSGDKYHGAYGYRIRKQFGFDQLERAFLALQSNPSSRQVVIQIWDPNADFPTESGKPVAQDIPCNICSMPKIRNDKLEWLQIMRSNDIYRGIPHNIIQFSTIQEILSGWIGVEIGSYHHISDSLHVYENDIPEISIDEHLIIPPNTDNIAVSKTIFDEHLNIICNRLSAFSSSSLTKNKFNEMIRYTELEQGYTNLLMITAADCARRREWYDLMEKSKDKCSNKLLYTAFDRWEKRYIPSRNGQQPTDMGNC